MSWHAKPSGPYATTSTEGTENILEINSILATNGYVTEAISGVIGNMIPESGLNPWRWQSDAVNLRGGYGLVQYTPASSYIDGARGLPGYSPNMSVTTVTSGATPQDGQAQVLVIVQNTLGKWIRGCWRDYWDPMEFPEYYELRQSILNNYGDGKYLSQSQFSKINNIRDATFAFLACFEGPAIPRLEPRVAGANAAYEIITGEPGPGPGPGPHPPFKQRKFPVWMMIKYNK